MDTAVPIDLDTWPRRSHFDHYRRRVPCTYAITVEIDVTDSSAASVPPGAGRTSRRCGRSRPW